MEILCKKKSELIVLEVRTRTYSCTCIIWSNFFTASLEGPLDGIMPLSPLPSSSPLFPGISGVVRIFGLFAPSSLWLLVLDGFVRGEEAGDAVKGDGRGC